MFEHASFWNRPDSTATLAAAAALLCSVVVRRAILCGLLVGLATGVLINLKITGPLYALPAFALLWAGRGRAALPAAIAAAAVTSAAPFFAYRNVSLGDYALWIRTSGANGLVFSSLRDNVQWALFLMLPLAPAFLEGTRRPLRPMLIAIGIGMGATVVAASNPGAGPYHLLPFLPAIAYAAAAAHGDLPTPARSSRTYRCAAAAFVVSLGASAVLQTAYFTWRAGRGPGTAIVADLNGVLERHPGAAIEMGYSSTGEQSTFLRPVLVFRQGRYFLDAPAIQEFQLSGLPWPTATTLALERCDIDVWLIPRGGEPFTLKNRYHSAGYAPLFPLHFRLAFANRYELVASTTYFDVWRCRRQDR
jgi:hypothetical protein